jgi:hypothetical protein
MAERHGHVFRTPASCWGGFPVSNLRRETACPGVFSWFFSVPQTNNHVGTSSRATTVCLRVIYIIHQGLVLRPFVLQMFALTPLINLHPLIFGLTPFDWFMCI